MLRENIRNNEDQHAKKYDELNYDEGGYEGKIEERGGMMRIRSKMNCR